MRSGAFNLTFSEQAVKPIWALAFIFLGLSFASTGLADAGTAPTVATLLSDRSRVPAGGEFNVGVLFKMQPGWHIYWKDPGDSGLPTKIQWSSPSSIAFGELQWPVHERFVSSGDIKSNGYSGSVLLWSKARAPDPGFEGTTITAQVSWLNCSNDLCVPARATYSITIAAGAEKASGDAALFTSWQQKLAKD